jgi:polysaccharide chain length determinant protein (PEP-CTERM system associated)
MLGHRTLNVEDYLNILKRRWWVIVVPAMIMTAVGIAATYFVTPQYQSTSLVLIDRQKVPSNVVQPVVTEALDTRLAYIAEQILSRNRLEPIINQYNLYGDQHLTMDARIDLTRHAIAIQAAKSDLARANGLPGFTIVFTAKDPHTAQQVCAQITGLFTEANLKQRQASADDTTAYLQEELDGAKRNLDDLDSKISAFQRAHAGGLPDDENNNMSIINSLNSQLDATTQSLGTLEQNKSVAETMLAQQVQAPVAAPVSQTPQVLQKQLDDLLAQQADLNAHYTPDYPDVKDNARKIADKRREIAKAESAPPPAVSSVAAPHPDSAGVVQLRAVLHGYDQAIAAKRKQQEGLQAEIRGYQGRVQASPEVAEQYKELTRGYTTASDFYNRLLQEKNSSQMTTDLEHRMQGETFIVLDPATLPPDPIFPKTIVFAAGGLGLGLVIGLMIAGLLEYKDTALMTERDVWEFTQLPTLAVIAWSGDAAKASPGLMKRLFSRKPKDMLADASG